MNNFSAYIARTLGLSERSVANTIELLNEGCTIPFISRYRKEKTGNLDEVKIAEISNLNDKLIELQKRNDTLSFGCVV
ncbi:MAG: Tex-like N-terminal domain-containing protein, partial [Prevotellaceae bacterium]|nr:Tex-like N-terminal domain-containing protein [Prevotellaceae bacterium]